MKQLKEWKHWINWTGKNKKPIGSINKVRLTFDEAVKNWTKTTGIGFILTIDDPFVAIDIDECVTDGVITDEAQEIIDKFNSYTELSPSGTGIHIWTIGKTNKSGKKKGNIEMYSSKRYMTVTLNSIGETEIIENQEAIKWLEEKLK